MVAEHGMEPAEECKNPPKHLPQAVRSAGTHMRPNRPARGERWHAAGRYSCTVVGSVTFFSLNDSPGISAPVAPCRTI